MSTYCTASGSRVLSLALALAMIGALAPQARGEPVAAPSTVAAEAGAARSSRAAARPRATPPQSESRAGRTEMAPQMSLAEGKSTLMRLPFAASRMSVGDPRIADVILLNPTEVYLLGRSVGTTNLILWNKANDATIV
ncbi:MAG: pilus assembly protein N-terminal domain-containing protein, partial [Janthinobacterium sp.]